MIEWLMKTNFHIRIMVFEGLVLMLLSFENLSKIIFFEHINATI